MDNLHERISTLETELALLKKQKSDFEEIQAHCQKMMMQLTQGASQISLLNEMVECFQKAGQPSHFCFVSCDKGGGNWRIDAGSDLVNELATPSKMMVSVPAELCYLQSEASFDIHEVDLLENNSWTVWQPWLSQHNLDSCLLKPIINTNNHVVGFAIIFTHSSYLNEQRYTLELMLNSVCSLILMTFSRDKMEEELLNSTYEDELTGLMQPKRFNSNFSIMMKDARRYFQRLALISVNIHSGQVSWRNHDIDDSDILELAKVMRSSIRENDLIGRFSQSEFVMGIRIRNLEDAETVAVKLLSQINLIRSKLSENTRVSLGISFYPEHSNYEPMFLAATNAAKNNGNEDGFKIEYHGRYCGSTADLYDF